MNAFLPDPARPRTVLLLGLLFLPALPSAEVRGQAPPPDRKAGPQRRPFALGSVSGYHSVAFSPDGRWVAAPGPGRSVKIWDAATGKEIRSLAGHTQDVLDVAFSPDGQRLASAGRDGVRLWDLRTGKLAFTTHGQSWADRTAFSPDGKHLVSAGARNVKLWEVATGKEVRTYADNSGWVASAVFSPDGQRLATGNIQKELKIWNGAGGVVHLLRGHTASIYTVAYSPRGRRLATASADNTAKIWDPAAGKELLTLRGHTGGVYTVAFSPDGRLLATASGDRTVKLWEALTGREVLALPGHKGAVFCAAFSPDGRRLATTGSDAVVYLWDLAPPGPAPVLTAADLEALWADLKQADGPRAFRAVFILSGSPRQAVPFLKARLRPADSPPADARRVARLVADLDDQRYAMRRQALRELAGLGKAAEPLVREALRSAGSLEARRQLERLLAGIEKAPPTPEQLLARRAVEVLERAGTAEARGVLQALARGAPGAWLTVEARAAAERLAPPAPAAR